MGLILRRESFLIKIFQLMHLQTLQHITSVSDVCGVYFKCVWCYQNPNED